MSIGFMAGSIDPLLLYRLHAVEHDARKLGYTTLVVFAPGRVGAFSVEDVRGLLDRRVDGLVIHSLATLSPEIKKLITQSETPTVGICRAADTLKHQLTINRLAGVREAADHLASLGHRNLTYAPIEFDHAYPRERLTPFRDTFAQAGIKMHAPKEWTIPVADSTDICARAFEVVRQRVREAEPPTALYIGDDELAIAAIAALRDAGLRVPEDVSVLGHDDISFAAYASPGLSTIHEPAAEAGAAALELLKRVMDKPDLEATETKLATRFVQRGSTAGARG
jgi:LacI family transcriptional regulator